MLKNRLNGTFSWCLLCVVFIGCKKESFYNALPFQTTEFSGRLKQPPGPPQDELFFLVDYSGSMKTVDPLVNQSCKRFTLAVEILSKLMIERRQLHVSLIGFSYSEDLLVGKLSLPDAINTFTSDYFCRYIEGTDYGLAFQNAYLFLRESVKKKKVILMSDGLPDTRAQNKREGKDPDPDNKIARQKGLASAEKIMALSQAEILVLFFNESLQGEIPIESMNYLTKITKKPSNVLSVFDSSFQNQLNQILNPFLR